MTSITITKIVNGFIIETDWRSSDTSTVYKPDMIGVIKHLDTVWGKIEREIKDKKQVREENRTAITES